MGALLLLITWPLIYLGAELLGVTTLGLKIVAFIYSVGMSVVLLLAAPLGFWSGIGLFFVAGALQFWLRHRRRLARQSDPSDVSAQSATGDPV